MSSISALSLITDAYLTLNVFQPGESIPNVQAQESLRHLNRFVGYLAQRGLMTPAIAREIYPNVTGKGGPSNPYTVGLGGDINTAKPPNQTSVTGAGLLLPGPSPQTEIPRAVMTDDGYQAIRQKELPNGLFTAIYYNPTYTTGFGTLNLWPVPDNNLNSLVLYLKKALTTFADLNTVYNIPDAYEDMLLNNLVKRMAKPNGVVIDDDMRIAAANSLNLIAYSNMKITDMPNDYAQMDDRRWGYNIQTGNM